MVISLLINPTYLLFFNQKLFTIDIVIKKNQSVSNPITKDFMKLKTIPLKITSIFKDQ